MWRLIMTFGKRLYLVLAGWVVGISTVSVGWAQESKVSVDQRVQVLETQIAQLLTEMQTLRSQRGEKGEKGENGKNGIDGKPGENGKDGKDGKPGEKGKDGIDGKPGENGKNGNDGKPGENGKDGKDGRPGTWSGGPPCTLIQNFDPNNNTPAKCSTDYPHQTGLFTLPVNQVLSASVVLCCKG
jgi:hypothetical protein